MNLDMMYGISTGNSMTRAAAITPLTEQPEIHLDTERSSFDRNTLGARELRTLGEMQRGTAPGETDRERLSLAKQDSGSSFEMIRSISMARSTSTAPETSNYLATVQVKIPTADEVIATPTGELQEIYQINDQILNEQAKAKQQQLSSLGFSGRGEKDLDEILSSKTGTYGFGEVYVFTVSPAPGAPWTETFLNIQEATLKAAQYSALKNSIRLQSDPVPGGIMVLEAGNATVVGSKGGFQLTGIGIEPLEEFRVMEARLGLTPRTFSSLKGVIGAARYESMLDIQNQLSAHASAIIATENETPLLPGDPVRDQRIAAHAELTERAILANRFVAQQTLKDVLSLLD